MGQVFLVQSFVVHLSIYPLHFKLAAFNIIKYLSNIQHNYTHHVLVNRGDI